MLFLSFLAASAISSESYELRLLLHAGQSFTGKLVVTRDNPATSAEIRETIGVRMGDGKSYVLDVTLNGITIDGRDRTAELNAMLSNPTASLGWNQLSQRVAPFSGLGFIKENPALMPWLAEAGLYLGCFELNKIKPGDTWSGSTTATGGCTSGQFRFVGVSVDSAKSYANLEITQIAMAYHDQIGPMKMKIDLSTGLPTLVDYKVKNKKTGRISRFVQTLSEPR